MGKFNFRYQSLLKIKERTEDLVRKKLSEAMEILDGEKVKLNYLKNQKSNCQESMASQISRGTDVAHLQTLDLYLVSMDKRIRRQAAAIEDCERQVHKIRMELLNATMEKKTYEKLKERYKEDFNFLEKKEEEKFIDELVTYKNFKGN